MLIDFRARPNTQEIISLYNGGAGEWRWLKRWGRPAPKAITLEEFVANVAACGIDRAVFTGRQVMDGEKISFGTSNDYVADCVKKYPDVFIGFAGIDMSAGAAAVREVERAVTKLGLKGISLDPSKAGVYANDKSVFPIYEKAAELGIPVVLTMGPFVGRFADPHYLDEPTAAFPNTNFILSHAVWPQTLDFLGLAYRRLNVFLEPSIYWTMPGSEPMFAAANGLLSEQILYASAFPFGVLDDHKRVRARWDWSEEAWERFTYRNAARILGLT